MTDAPAVIAGWWRDYSGGGRVVLVPDHKAQIIAIAIALWLALAWQPCWIIAQSLFTYFSTKRQAEQSSRRLESPEFSERVSLLRGETQSPRRSYDTLASHRGSAVYDEEAPVENSYHEHSAPVREDDALNSSTTLSHASHSAVNDGAPPEISNAQTTVLVHGNANSDIPSHLNNTVTIDDAPPEHLTEPSISIQGEGSFHPVPLSHANSLTANAARLESSNTGLSIPVQENGNLRPPISSTATNTAAIDETSSDPPHPQSSTMVYRGDSVRNTTSSHTSYPPTKGVGRHCQSKYPWRREAFKPLLFIGLSVLITFLSNEISFGKTALLKADYCGVWRYDWENDEVGALEDDLRWREYEARASQYARACYGPAVPGAPISCDFFSNRSIGYTQKSGDICPFSKNTDICLHGRSAVTFDTGLVDAGEIGINAPKRHKFRRTTTCSPLKMSEKYIKHDNATDQYFYRYGSIQRSGHWDDYILKTSGNDSDVPVPVYSVRAYVYDPADGDNYIKPIDELMPPDDSTLTLLFVSTMKIFHVQPSIDPMFPAGASQLVDGIEYYRKADPRATVMACIDKAETCLFDGSRCWPVSEDLPETLQDTTGYWLLHLALEHSNIYDSIALRLGTALLAQDRVSISKSLPIRKNHWELEAKQLFETSLARIQYDAWSIATGENHHRKGYIDMTPPKAAGRLCGIYKFTSIGHTNLRIWLLCLLFFVPIIFGLYILIVCFCKGGDVSNYWAEHQGTEIPLAVMVLQIIQSPLKKCWRRVKPATNLFRLHLPQ